MSNENDSGCLVLLASIIRIACWITSGLIAWDWIEPNNFFGVLVFLFVCGMLGAVFDYILLIIFSFIEKQL